MNKVILISIFLFAVGFVSIARWFHPATYTNTVILWLLLIACMIALFMKEKSL